MPSREPSTRLLPLEIQVRKTIRDYDMLAPADHVLVAVSGGADSMALLLCLRSLASSFKLTLTVAHLNHRIRGTEADADEDFVRGISAGLGLPFVSEIIEIKQQAAAQKENLEDLARRLRYDFLRRSARRVGANKIAVGHNLNDQAETALFRFVRGSGLEGLSSIHPVVDGLVIRPLLECSRRSILRYLDRKGAVHREDSTNRDCRLSRNRIRRELLPYLESAFNPKLVPALAREALLARETWSYIQGQAREAYLRLHRRLGEGIALEIKNLLQLHPVLQKEVLRQALRVCRGSLRGINSAHIESILSLCKSGHGGNRIQVPRGGIAIRQSGTLLLLERAPQPCPAFVYELCLPGQCLVAEGGTMFQSSICVAPDLDTMKKERSIRAFLEPSVLPPSLTVRSRLPGDRYGGAGRRKVKKMLIDSKIPHFQRSILPMVVAGGSVIWIPGFRPARGYEARPESPRCIAVEISREEERLRIADYRLRDPS